MKQYLKKMNSQSGFTIIELLVVVAIIGIVAAVAASTDMSSRSAVGASAKEIMVMMQAARMEAIRTGRNAIIERPNVSVMRVYIDENGDNVVSNGDRLTADFELFTNSIMPNELPYLAYNNRGYLVNDSNNQVAIKILVCEPDKDDPSKCEDLISAISVSASLSGLPSLSSAQ